MTGATARMALKMMPLLFLLASCLGQDRGGAPPGDGYVLIGGVLSKALASGSLEFWGECDV